MVARRREYFENGYVVVRVMSMEEAKHVETLINQFLDETSEEEKIVTDEAGRYGNYYCAECNSKRTVHSEKRIRLSLSLLTDVRASTALTTTIMKLAKRTKHVHASSPLNLL